MTDIRATDISQAKKELSIALPVFSSTVQAGFPSPADDYIEGKLDLNELIVRHPAATFFVRVQGESMNGAGIHTDDILVVDRSLEVSNGNIIVAIVDGEFTVKRYVVEGKDVFLVPENGNFSRLKISENSEFQVWGVVTYVIHKAR